MVADVELLERLHVAAARRARELPSVREPGRGAALVTQMSWSPCRFRPAGHRVVTRRLVRGWSVGGRTHVGPRAGPADPSSCQPRAGHRVCSVGTIDPRSSMRTSSWAPSWRSPCPVSRPPRRRAHAGRSGRRRVQEREARHGHQAVQEDVCREEHGEGHAGVRREDRAGRRGRETNAAQDCRAERDADRAAFEEKYGTNKNKRNAFGKCVSAKATDATEDAARTEQRRSGRQGAQARRRGRVRGGPTGPRRTRSASACRRRRRRRTP